MRLAAPADAVADALWRAHADGGRVASPSATLPGLDLDGGYAIQEALVARLVAAGQRPIGWKVGMASAIGRGPDSPGPIYGRLLSGMLVEDGGALRVDTLHEPHAEGEIAFVLGAPLRGPGVEIADVLAATAGVRPAIEVFARRLEPDAVAVPDAVADNASCARVVLGRQQVEAGAIDLRLTGLVLRRGEAIVATGAGGQVLGHPARSVAWLANALERRGQGIEAGEVVITGAVAGAHPASAGDDYVAEFDRLGTVQVRCT